jgi:hypothetical protein
VVWQVRLDEREEALHRLHTHSRMQVRTCDSTRHKGTRHRPRSEEAHVCVVQVGVLRKALQQLSTMGLGGDSAVPAPHAAQQPSLFDRAKVLTGIDPPTRETHAVALV